MATLISRVSGNLTDAATWALANSVALLDSEAGNTALTTSYVESSAFTPGAITIDGIAIKLASRAASPTGTISVRLAQGGSLVAGAEVVLNVSDLPTCSTAATANEGGWILFKFAAPVLLLAATAYTISAKTSSATQVNLYRNATAGNWSRLLRTTTTQAPVAGDVMHVMGEHTGAGTGNNYTVTMDSTATTDYGAGTDGAVGLSVSKRSTLTYGTAAATNYYLKISGEIIVYNGGTLNKGTTGTPTPRDSTMVLECDPVADGGMGLYIRNGGTYTDQGQSRTVAKNIIDTYLNADLAVAETTLNVTTDTGWLNGDQIVIGKTNRSNNVEAEKATLTGAAGASSMTVTAGVGFSHAGTGYFVSRIGLLTRNNIFRSASSTIHTYFRAGPTANIDIDWAEYYYLGGTTTGKRGIEIETTTGTFEMHYSSLHDTRNYGLRITSASGSGINIDTNIFAYLNTTATAGVSINPMRCDATTGVITFTNNIIYNVVTGANGACAIVWSDAGSTFTNNYINDGTSSRAILVIGEGAVVGTISGNIVSCSRTVMGMTIGDANFSAANISGVIGTNTVILCNGSPGFRIGSNVADLTINDLISVGNSTNSLEINSGGKMTFNNVTLGGLTANGTTNATTNGVAFSTGTLSQNVLFTGGNIGVATGNYLAHTNDVLCSVSTINALFDNVLFGSSTLISTYLSLLGDSVIAFNKLNQTVNKHRWYTRYGSAQSAGAGLTDTTIRTASSLGLRLSPEDSGTGFSWSYQILAKAGSAVYANGFIRKNTAFATDVVTVELFLPGSTTADSTYTMSNTTDNWEAFVVNASYTGSIDLYATVKITAKTTTAAAYLYVDDLYNGTNKITALDVWEYGVPSQIMFEQLGDASAVWSVATTAANTDGTVGSKLNALLELSEFLALK